MDKGDENFDGQFGEIKNQMKKLKTRLKYEIQKGNEETLIKIE